MHGVKLSDSDMSLWAGEQGFEKIFYPLILLKGVRWGERVVD